MPIDAQEILLAIVVRPVVSISGWGTKFSTYWYFGATESEESFSIAVGDFIRPFAAVGLRIESQSVGTYKIVAYTVHAVSESAAIAGVA